MPGDWRDYRPALWVAMLGVALALLITPPYIGAIFIGAAIGIAIKVTRRRQAATPARRPRR